ncbi:pilus assembly protein [Marinobacter sp. BSs20148]|uniref:pilus assembly protein n=1 Tax=Marinobacter sp. BSs20148 TaxID=490759 RepID=UPI00027768FB|nr:PilC/PilY family type IV pilus protein [Marinobacter sp. BSs20148]AFP29669.1 hypothetical protein MRBBS_0731 [Marinobacter sp. BSs20148]
MNNISQAFGKSEKGSRSRIYSFLAALLVGIAPMQYTSAAVSQVPLYLGGGGVPGNLVLTPSVEWPTVQSLANLGTYSASIPFEGYFDSAKCYKYSFAGSNDAGNHFFPSSNTSSRTCAGSGDWSGNFLNWATTQTIDPFRKVLTGGYRVKDTAKETWLEKARHPGQNSVEIKTLNDKNTIEGATPFVVDKIRIRIHGLEKNVRFSLDDDSYNAYEVDYDPGNFPQKTIPVSGGNDITKFSYLTAIRVKVCDSSVGLEDNCKEYSQGWKPEGVMQQNSDRIRYSVFGYLNDNNISRDGGVLRARQKYIGPKKFVKGQGFIDNPNKEWDPVTGVMIKNPDAADASATPGTIVDSGAMNYINKFGQLNTNNFKSIDPVSELYYAATRYLKNQGNVASYSDLSTNTGTRDKQTDNFPVIATWDDPMQFECQPNVILGIGDTNTHRDKNLPGNNTYRNDEPTMPGSVSSDNTIDVVTATNRVGEIEGIGNIGNTQSFSGRNNSAYMAGLAYDNHTVDMRSDLAGKQTAATHWVDVLENQVLQGTSTNQYYLATKYGGFDVPDSFDPYSRTASLPDEWWNSPGNTVSWGNTSFKRPDNFYIAGRADLMIESLQEAFKNISAELASSSSSVAANSTSLQSDTAIYQASFNSSLWSGEISAYTLTGATISAAPVWTASTILDARDNSDMTNRNILTAVPLDNVSGTLLSTTGSSFKWAQLDAAQQASLAKTATSGSSVSTSVAQDRLNYLRGDRAKERTTANQIREFRQRGSRLGDVINSSPVYVGQENYGYYRLGSQAAFSGITSYADFRDTSTYKNRPPFLLVGANDGMLHAFDASIATGGDGGKELFAYVPAGIYDNLWELTDPNYSHRYFVDGTPRVSDMWLGSTLGWKTVAVATTGAGGRSVFALDVTDPENMATTNVLWEFSHNDMGLTMQQPATFALPTGKFGVAVSSGYDTSLTNGKVWFLNAANGQVIKEIAIPTNGAELGSPHVIDTNGDRIADRMYVADTGGAVWRIDLDDSDVANWDAPTNLKSGGATVPLFQAATGQAITADLVAALNESGEVMVFFGTGSFQNIGENVVGNSPTVESFYGIIDRGAVVARNTLLEQEIVAETTVTGNRFRRVTKNSPTGTFNGWYMDLVVEAINGGGGPKGERVISQALVRTDRVIFPTLIPSEDPCAAGGQSWLMELALYSGAQLDYEVFDVNNDGVIDENDTIPGEDKDGDGNPDPEPPSGIDPDIGIIQKPTVIEDCVNGEECKIVSGSSGQAETIIEKAIQTGGRVNWEQLR